jgi:predicted dehydrogenase
LQKLKFALVGAGGFGAYYIDTYFHVVNKEICELVGIIDPFVSKSTNYPKIVENQIPVYDTLEQFYMNHTADLVVVSTPISLHESQCITALRNNSHVLCEKPTAATVDQAIHMQETASRYGKHLFIGFQLCFSQSILNLKKDILSGRFGKLKKLKSLVLFPRDWNYFKRNNWAGKIKGDDGQLVLDSVISNGTAHYLHNLLFLMGSEMGTSSMPEKIKGSCYRANEIESFDTCVLKAYFENAVELLYVTSHCTDETVDPCFELEFEHATVKYDKEEVDEFVAYMHNGEIVKYGNPFAKEERSVKFISTINWLRDQANNERPCCEVETTLPFMTITNGLFQFLPIYSFAEEDIVADRDLNRTYVRGLGEKLVQCYRDNKLWSEIDTVPSKPETEFSLVGYHGYRMN